MRANEDARMIGAATRAPFRRPAWLADVPWVARAACWATIVVEAGYPVFVWPRRTRVPWVVATIALHVGIAAALSLSRRTIGKRLKKLLEHTRARAGTRAFPGAARRPQGAPGSAPENAQESALAPAVAPSDERDERWR